MTTPDLICSNCGKKPVLVRKVMLCSGCYWRQRRHGTTEYRRPPKGSTALERYEFYVARSDDPDGCWLWRGGVNSTEEGRDYGLIWDGSQRALAHRWAYEHFVRPIPDGQVIDHKCETPRCVRPDHLEPVTQPVNVERGTRWPVNPDIPRENRGDLEANRPNCPECGHPYRVRSNGKRYCLNCRNSRSRKRARETGTVTGEGTGARQRERTHCPQGHEYTSENTYVSAKGSRDCKICRKERNRRSRERNRVPIVPVTTCASGHEFTPENTIIRSNGRRACRACTNVRRKEFRQRKRAERLTSPQVSRRKLCALDCTCARHTRSGPRSG